MGTENRLVWADYMKAIAITLMVLGHANFENDCKEVIYLFHMPVFFMLSGYFDKGEIINRGSLVKSFKRLMIPFFFFSIISFSICWISPYLHPEIYHMDTFTQIFKANILGMIVMDDQVTPWTILPGGPLWFLPALFLTKIFFSSFFSLFSKRRYFFLIASISLLIALFIFWPFKIHPMSFDSAILALPFYSTGYITSVQRKFC